MDFSRICFGCPIIEGYGMTETSCAISTSEEGDNLSGHVDSPSPAWVVKLVDVPEMNYTSVDQPNPRGEICVRGPNIFQGYFKDEVQTEVFDADGWYLKGGSRLLIGDSLNSNLAAVVSVEPHVLKGRAMSAGIMWEDLGQICKDARARAAVLAGMDVVAQEAQLRKFEYAKAVTLVLEPFTLENGLLTPTFKRPQAKEYFSKAISDMYAELDASDSIQEKF